MIECHKLGLQTKEIVAHNSVNERQVRHLVARYNACGGLIHSHWHGGGPVKKQLAQIIQMKELEADKSLIARRLKK